jgi:hypothetical protein
MAAPLGSETVPLTCATAVAWAQIEDGMTKRIRRDVSKDKLANVNRDVCIMTNP